MSGRFASGERRPTRRGFLSATAGFAAGTTLAIAEARPAEPAAAAASPTLAEVEPFFGAHQGGIVTPAQTHTYLAAFDVTTSRRDDLLSLLRRWTEAGAMLSVGRSADPAHATEARESGMGDIAGLAPSRLTLTFGFGAGLFAAKGVDRFGLKARRPDALIDLPNFPGEQLAPERTGGDLLVQACADNPQVVFHAVRQLAGLAYGVAELRWVQAGFISDYGSGRTPRNMMGFKDGTGNPPATDPDQMRDVVWCGDEAPGWMRGGSYLVVRRARIALEHWERMPVSFQEQTFGRQKTSGAPLGAQNEFDRVDLDLKDADGNPVVPENSHVRLANRHTIEGSRIFRRSYSYSDGANVVAERWPPWKRGMEFDAGLIFMCYQRDPRSGFVKIFETLSRFDMMNQFVTNTGGGLFACPGGVLPGEFIGQRLFQAAA